MRDHRPVSILSLWELSRSLVVAVRAAHTCNGLAGTWGELTSHY